jgi:hypothetical protein
MHGAVAHDNAPRRSRIPSECSGSVHSVSTSPDRQHRLRRTAAIRRARDVRHRQRPDQRDGQQDQRAVSRQIVRYGCRDPHEGKACVGPFLQGWQAWQEQRDGSGQLRDAEENTQLLGISHSANRVPWTSSWMMYISK